MTDEHKQPAVNTNIPVLKGVGERYKEPQKTPQQEYVEVLRKRFRGFPLNAG